MKHTDNEQIATGFNMNGKYLSIEKEILEEIQNRMIVDDLPSFFEAPNIVCAKVDVQKINPENNGMIARFVGIMHDKSDNRAYRELRSNRKLIGPAIVFCKKVVRKLLKWYIEPVSNQQSDFNHATADAFDAFLSSSTETTALLQQNVESISFRIDETCERFDMGIMNLNRDTEAVKKNLDEHVESTEANLTAMQKNLDTHVESTEANLMAMQKNLDTHVESTEVSLAAIQKDLDQHTDGFEDSLKSIQNRVDAEVRQLDERLISGQDRVQLLEKSLLDAIDKINRMEDEQRRQADSLEIATKANVIHYSFGEIESSSQSGEDTIVAYVLDSMNIPFSKCTYLDLGANHPKCMSNSYLLYRFGARGVLVEANPMLIPELEAERAGDLILNRCIADKSGEFVDFYIMSGDGLSTPDYSYAKECIEKNPALRIDQTVSVETISLSDLLKTYFRVPPTVVNIDVEGMVLQLLKDIDLHSYRPFIIIIETIPYSPKLGVQNKDMEIIRYMESMGYSEYAFTGINSIFIDTCRLAKA